MDEPGPRTESKLSNIDMACMGSRVELIAEPDASWLDTDAGDAAPSLVSSLDLGTGIDDPDKLLVLYADRKRWKNYLRKTFFWVIIYEVLFMTYLSHGNLTLLSVFFAQCLVANGIGMGIGLYRVSRTVSPVLSMDKSGISISTVGVRFSLIPWSDIVDVRTVTVFPGFVSIVPRDFGKTVSRSGWWTRFNCWSNYICFGRTGSILIPSIMLPLTVEETRGQLSMRLNRHGYWRQS